MRPTHRALRLATATTSRAPRLSPTHLKTRPAFSSPRPSLQPSSYQHRTFSNSVPPHPLPSGLALLTTRRILSLTGPDTAKFLQGLITANITPGHATPNPAAEHIRTDAGFYAAFLNAQGRVLYDVFIYRDGRDGPGEPGGEAGWLIEVDAAEAKALQAHLRRYKLRAKVQVRLLEEEEVRVWEAWDDTNHLNPAAAFSPEAASSSSLITIPDPRAPNLGHRILTFSSSSTPVPLEWEAAPEAAYHLRRYLNGVPEGAGELTPSSALPHESNLDLMGVTTGTAGTAGGSGIVGGTTGGAIDFRKGCYVGQELTIRTEHRGVVRKRVLPCLLYPDTADSTPPSLTAGTDLGATDVTASAIPPSSSIKRLTKSGRSAGKWLHGIGNVGLALCRLETMTDVVLPGEAGTAGFVEGDEFYVDLGDGEPDKEGVTSGGSEGGRVRVKAFVPGWLRSGLAGKGGSGH
ncbi:uncharacterized protein C8A04DRAFT_12201 [Dichotomopilus funicola]|uniref:Iron-sulfur cluster assembly factor IBA57 homolog, mitochondrial n=1 Tax=Dichotomopilus funicola TaxID=1934379 RepID=A0AAN6ZMZ4_9PEZI|nr:hypothetical protein C8A04DRAFT_12201 [Dichotomopilus funicola]